MVSQLNIDFSQVLHVRENSRSNEVILNDQKVRLTKNCKTIYDALIRGEKLTGQTIIEKYKMMEYRRRILDLKEAGLEVQETSLENGCKCWFL